MRISIPRFTAISLALLSSSAWADTILFSDLGPSGSVYNGTAGEALLGSANFSLPGTPAAFGELFTVSGTGSEGVGQIDLAVSNISGLNTFTASIWTDVGGMPASQVVGAFWSLSTNAVFGTCCSLIAVPVSGVTLTGGQQYFMVLGPASFSDNSYNAWDTNNQGYTGSVEYSANGTTFLNNGTPAGLGAFDVLGTPEPTSFAPCAIGLAALLVMRSPRRLGRARRSLNDAGTDFHIDTSRQTGE